MLKYNEGDTIEIISNIPFQLKKKKKPLSATIINIDGNYILVRPKYQRYRVELYPNEIKLVRSCKK